MKIIGTTAAGNELIEAPAGHCQRMNLVIETVNAIIQSWGGLVTMGNDSTVTPAVLPKPISPVIRPKPDAKPAGKVCSECGKGPLPSGARKTCGPDCATKRNARLADEATKRRAKLGGRGEDRVCVTCGKSFTPVRKDQKCCNTACGKSRPKSSMATPRTPPPAMNKAARLDMIRRAAKALPPVPPDDSYVDDDDVAEDRD